MMPAVLTEIPNPPIEMRTPETADAIFSVLMIALALAAVLAGLVYWRRQRSPLPLLIVLGGACAMLIEPIVDVLGGCWWPRVGGWKAFTLFDTPVPVWAAACHFWYVGGQALITWKVLSRNPTRRSVWQLWVAFMAADLALEVPATLIHIYKYYGHQPLSVGGLPLWWLPVNGSMALVAGVLVWRTAPLLRGASLLLAIPLVVMGDSLANGAAGWPAWLALHSNWPQPVAHVAGVVCYGMAALLIWGVSLVVEPDACPLPAEPPGADSAMQHRLATAASI
jgi:hypothetical protein